MPRSTSRPALAGSYVHALCAQPATRPLSIERFGPAVVDATEAAAPIFQLVRSGKQLSATESLALRCIAAGGVGPYWSLAADELLEQPLSGRQWVLDGVSEVAQAAAFAIADLARSIGATTVLAEAVAEPAGLFNGRDRRPPRTDFVLGARPRRTGDTGRVAAVVELRTGSRLANRGARTERAVADASDHADSWAQATGVARDSIAAYAVIVDWSATVEIVEVRDTGAAA